MCIYTSIYKNMCMYICIDIVSTHVYTYSTHIYIYIYVHMIFIMYI